MADSEFSIIQRYFAHQPGQRRDVLLGIGDDAALLSVPAGQALVVTLDTLVCGTHFLASAPPDSIGHKALAVNLSDLAAMGAEPAWVTLALTLPKVDQHWLDGFCHGFFSLAAQHNVTLVGGDTTSGPLAISVQAHGFAPPLQTLRRSAARPGDCIFVTGTPGDAGLALAVAAKRQAVATEHHTHIQNRLDRPQPRIRQGLDLRGIASAAIDISDGLAQDLGHILTASHCGASLYLAQLPYSAALTTLAPDTAAQLALSGGDDYELCFTVPPHQISRLYERAAAWDCRCTEIGVIERQPGLRCYRPDGTVSTLDMRGYEHFT